VETLTGWVPGGGRRRACSVAAGQTGEGETTVIAGWVTNAGDQVGVGDLVALRTVAYRDTIGRIVGPLSGGLVECLVVGTESGASGFRRAVSEDELLLRARGGGEGEMRDRDYEDRARVVAVPAEPDTDDKDTDEQRQGEGQSAV
jgi:hypothetical protein